MTGRGRGRQEFALWVDLCRMTGEHNKRAQFYKTTVTKAFVLVEKLRRPESCQLPPAGLTKFDNARSGGVNEKSATYLLVLIRHLAARDNLFAAVGHDSHEEPR